MSKVVGAIAFVGAAGGLYYLWRENERQKAEFIAEQDALFHQANLQLQQQQAKQRQPSNPWAPVLSWGLDQVFNGTKSNKSGGGLGGFLDGLFGRHRAPSGTKVSDSYTTKVGGVGSARATGPAGVDFAAHEQQYGLPSGYLHRTAQIESAMNPNAKNPNSSAGGLFQFIDATARQYGLKNRYDPNEATDAASRLARDNANYLRRKLGREPTAAELYLAHQQGAGGAAKLLADPNRRASEVVGSKAVRLNGGNESMTSGQFADKWLDKFNAGYV